MVKFSTEDKLVAVQRYLSGSESFRTIGSSIGAIDYMVRTWVKQYERNGLEALKSPI